MRILPAIDLRGGQCVRLRQGDYAQETVFAADPAAAARRLVEQGASELHLVDLDGARAGHPINGPAIQQIVKQSGVPCQLGGGLRTEAHVAEALRWGIARAIVGTRALKDPDGFAKLCERYPRQITLGVDARHGRVATEGWLESSDIGVLDLARRFAHLPLAALVYTDISKDGMLEGPNVEAMGELARALDLPVIASGGVTTLEDVQKLAATGVAGCIVGRALYEGRLDLIACLAWAAAAPGGRRMSRP